MAKKAKNIIGPRVRRIRDEKNLSQADLSAICQRLGWDITRDTIAKIESKSRWVGDFELVYLAKALKVSINYLVEGK